MRMFLVVVMMVLVSLAILAGLMLPAAAQTPAAASATLTGDCGGKSLAADVDTLLTCRFRATNTGDVPVVSAQLAFNVSNAAPPPDRYYFFRARLDDGPPMRITGSDLIYDMGDIAPGQSATLELEVIVRTSHRYGADVSLLAQPSQHEYARITLANEVGGAAPSPGLRVQVGPGTSLGGSFDQPDGPPFQRAPLELMIVNDGPNALHDLDIQVAFGSALSFEPNIADAWSIDPGSGHLVLRIAELAVKEGRGLLLPLVASVCSSANAGVVVNYDGGHAVAALDDGSLLGFCDAVSPPSEFPHGGSGPGHSFHDLRVIIAALFAVGLCCATAGAVTTLRSGRGGRARGSLTG